MNNRTSENKVAVALLHHPVLNRQGETSTTAITAIDVHDFARSCAFYQIGPVYLVHPAQGMHALVHDMTDYWLHGAGGERNPRRRHVLQAIRMVYSLEDILEEADYQLWYTSAQESEHACVEPAELAAMEGKHLIVFVTGSGLDSAKLPTPNGWLSPIVGIGSVRHLSVRAALAIYLDRLGRNPD